MKLAEATERVIALIRQDAQKKGVSIDLDTRSPDGDPGKFVLAGRVARVVIPHNGYNPKISGSWWSGGDAVPTMSGGEFHWYVFPIRRGADAIIGYFIADYHKLKEWVLDFRGPLGNDHRDHEDWRCGITTNAAGHTVFYWGDEHWDAVDVRRRHVQLSNIADIVGQAIIREPTPIAPARHIVEAEDDDGRMQHSARKVRKGQPKFRRALLSAYDSKCAITGVEVVDVLEAAHIQLWAKRGRNASTNGILLRADLHSLFDGGLLRIEPETLRVWIHPSIRESEYGTYHDGVIATRTDAQEPDKGLLRERWLETTPKSSG